MNTYKYRIKKNFIEVYDSKMRIAFLIKKGERRETEDKVHNVLSHYDDYYYFERMNVLDRLKCSINVVVNYFVN